MEISDSDDNSLPSVREILAGLKQKEVIDLTADDDDSGGDGDEEDIIEVSGLRPAQYPVRLILSLINRHYQPTNFDPHRPYYRTRPHRPPTQ